MKEIIYSKEIKEELKPGNNYNTLVVSAPGKGKTYSYVMPNIASMIGSYVIVETKNKLYKEYGEYLKINGYEVMHFDLDNLENSMHYNPFCFLKTSNDVMELCETFFPSNQRSNDPYWNEAAKTLLSHYCYALLEFEDKEHQNISTLLDLAAKDVPLSSDATANQNMKYEYYRKFIELIEEKYPDSYTIKTRNALGGVSKVNTTFSCIKSVFSTAMRLFSNKRLLEWSLNNELHLEGFMDKKIAIFINVNDVKTANYPLVSIMLTHIMKTLIEIADNTKDKMLKEHCFFMLDDAANYIQNIPIINNFIAVSRSRNISTSIICQSVAQLHDKGINPVTIVDNMAKILYLGSLDPSTTEFFGRITQENLNKITYFEDDEFLLIDNKRGPKISTKYYLYNHPFYKEREN